MDVLILDEALKNLAQFDPRQARIVELHFFSGLTFAEIALVLKVTERTVKRDWSMARAWLKGELSKSP
jgi:RNA polymerase sigma factor (sigma-70 family)